MPRPATANITIWRGDTLPPVRWFFGKPEDRADLSHAIFELTVEWPANPEERIQRGSYVLTSNVDPNLMVSGEPGLVEWKYTKEQIRKIPIMAEPTYNLRRIDGAGGQTWVWGQISALGPGNA